jgi:hypothetical protein
MLPTQEETAESRFVSWSVPQFPRTIEYSRDLMEQIRSYACSDLSRLSHGGCDVGGVLFGLELDGVLRILTWRAITCEYAEGQVLRLSARDRMNLAVQMEAARRSPELKDMRPVGWFVAHPRGNVAMTRDDLENFSNFFPGSSQFTLVIVPGAEGHAEAGFFVREADGSVRSEESYRKFTLEPIQPTMQQATADVKPSAEVKPSVAPVAPVVAVSPPRREAPPVPVSVPAFGMDEPLPARDRLLWAIPIALALGIAAWLLYQSQKPAHGPQLSFHVSAINGRGAELAWDANSEAVRNAQRGELNITDGGESSQVALSSDQVHAGRMTYVARSGDTGFELVVYPATGAAIRESTRLIAPAAPDTPSVRDTPAAPAANLPDTRNAELEQQVEQLKQQLAKERSRSAELQNLVRILEARLGVQTRRQP